MYIYSPNGIQMLNIPIKTFKRQTSEIKMSALKTILMAKNHFKSLEAAYRTSGLFLEYFEDDFRPLFEKRHEF